MTQEYGRSQNPLDNFWMTPSMGLRMQFDFAQNVIAMTQTIEQRRQKSAEAPAAAEPPTVQPAAAPAQSLPLPPLPPPSRFLRY